MAGLLGLAALAAFAAGLFVAGSVRSDIQLQIVATCWIGGFILSGLSHIAGRLARIARNMEDRAKREGRLV